MSGFSSFTSRAMRWYEEAVSLQSVASDLTSAVIAAALIAVLVYLANHIRNWKLEHIIQRGITVAATDWATEGNSITFGFGIINSSSTPVRIRGLILYAFYPDGRRKILRFNQGRVGTGPLVFGPRGDGLPVGRYKLGKSFSDAENGEALLLPMCSSGWWASEPLDEFLFIEEIIVSFEYPTIFGYSIIRSIPVPHQTKVHVQAVLHAATLGDDFEFLLDVSLFRGRSRSNWKERNRVA